MENKFEGGKIGSWETGQEGTVMIQGDDMVRIQVMVVNMVKVVKLGIYLKVCLKRFVDGLYMCNVRELQVIPRFLAQLTELMVVPYFEMENTEGRTDLE